ncbi:MAG: hypothetical protein L0154_07680 [Chloroflexi bacterium]|nr:hypothetical protein [Chloroflexota bacterium]
MRYHLYNLATKFNNPLAQRALVTVTVVALAFIFGDGMHLLDDDPLAGGGSGG